MLAKKNNPWYVVYSINYEEEDIMKKMYTLFLALSIFFSCTFSTHAMEIQTEREPLSLVSEVFGIPMDVLAFVDVEMLDSLIYAAENNEVIDSSEAYIKVTMDETGDISMSTASYQEYLRDTVGSYSVNASTTDSSSGWMRFYTTVLSVNSTTGQASCSFKWLTSPSPRLKDVVGLALRNGTVKSGTANGFYSHSSPNTKYYHTFTSSEIRESGEGVTANFKLKLTDYVSEASDFAFIQTNFIKEGKSEGVTGTYAHQKFQLAVSPSFSINRQGLISISSGLKIVTYYVQDTGYVSIMW